MTIDSCGAMRSLQLTVAVVMTSAALAAQAPVVRNASAISMRVALRGGPGWLLMAAPAQLPAQAVTLLRPAFTPAMPAGEHAVQLQIEVMNLHPSPGRNLTVTVPLTVRND
jgi:hypothetical protein